MSPMPPTKTSAALSGSGPGAIDPGLTESADSQPFPYAAPTGLPEIRATGSRKRAVIALVLILTAIGLVVFRGLGNATLFFLNADEAKARAVDLGIKRFRLQGIVAEGSVKEAPSTVDFDVEFNGTKVHVRHAGAPPELFRTGIAVVLEGNFETKPTGNELPDFLSDRILVKHDENYIQKNRARVKDAVDAPS